jgi:hypothetical protein
MHEPIGRFVVLTKANNIIIHHHHHGIQPLLPASHIENQLAKTYNK